MPMTNPCIRGTAAAGKMRVSFFDGQGVAVIKSGVGSGEHIERLVARRATRPLGDFRLLGDEMGKR